MLHFRTRSAGPARRVPTAVLVVGLTLAGCLSLEPGPRVPAPAAAVPDAYPEPTTAPFEPLAWWVTFEDPVLDRLVDTALVANLDLAEAAARVDAVRAQYRIARSPLFPGASASVDATYTDAPASTAAQPGSPVPTGSATERFEGTSYRTSIGFAYELDFWGTLRNDARAALGELYASEADFHTIRLGVLAETIATYFEIVDLRARIATLVRSIDVLSERVERTEERYDRGLVSSFELYQIRQDYRNTQATLPQLESTLADAERRLAFVLGRYPSGLAVLLTDELAPRLVFDPVPTGLPADLLLQRPDVRAAAYRLEAARYAIGARRGELFPSVSLSGSLGTQSDEVAELFDVLDAWVLNLGASLTAPLFQGGRIRAAVDVAEAQYAQQAAAYARTVLRAFGEVVVALTDYEEQRQRYAFLLAQLDEARASADLQADRYESGLTAYTDYLDALRALYQVESALSSAGRAVALARLAVHRALGGSWAAESMPDRVRLVPQDVPLPPARVRSTE